MLVTNLQRFPVGIDGVYNLGPLQSREIPETEDLIMRVKRLKEVNYVSVQFTEAIVAPVNQEVIPAVDNVGTIVDNDEAVNTNESVISPIENDVVVVAEEVNSDEVSMTVESKPRKRSKRT